MHVQIKDSAAGTTLPRNGSVMTPTVRMMSSGGATTLIFTADGADAVCSSIVRSHTSGNKFCAA